MSSKELNKMYSILSYPGNNNHDDFFPKGVYPYIKDYKINSILEAGCGTGAMLYDIARIYPNADILAIDFTENSIQKAIDKLKSHTNVRFRMVDLMSTDMETIGKFDFIHCQGVLHHLDAPEKGLQNLINCLNTDGKLYLWVYLAKGREEISDIKELMKPFSNEDYDTKLRIVSNLIALRGSAKKNKKHKRYLKKKNKFGFLGKIARFLMIVEENGILHSTSKVRHKILGKIFKNNIRQHQKNIGIADENLNPNEYFYTINEFFDLLSRNNMEVDLVVDGISRNLNDIGSGGLRIEPEIEAMNERWKWRLIELFDEPRGVGVLCSKAKQED